MPEPIPESSPKWYDVAFDEDYLLRYAHRDEEEAELAAALAARATELQAGARAFDLCCGAGRHLHHLEEAGFEPVGGDLSLPLLRQAHASLRRGGLETPVVRMDMRHLPLRDASIDLLTNYFTAFGYFEEDRENFRVLDEVARVLRTGGWFLLDFFNSQLVRRSILESPEERRVLDDGETWIVQRSLGRDGQRAEKIARKTLRDQVVREIRESVRLYTPAELRTACRDRALVPRHEFGDYTGAPFQPEQHQRYIIVAQRA